MACTIVDTSMTLYLLIQSLLVYTIWGWGMYRFAQVGSMRRSGEGTTVSPMAIILCVSLFAFFGGVRWGVGEDYYAYYYSYELSKYFNKIARTRDDEIGWNIITEYMAVHDVHFTIYFGFWAALQALFICLALKDEPKVFPYAMLLCVLGNYLFTMMGIIRQAVVCCSLLWAAHFINSRRIVLFLIWVALAATIHKSAYIVAPLFLLAYNKREWLNRNLLMAILIVCVAIGYAPIVGRLSNLIPALDFLEYDSYVENFDNFADETKFHTSSWGPIRLGNFIVATICIYMYPKVSDYFKSDYLKLAFKIYFIGYCMLNVFYNTIDVFVRPTLYFHFFSIPVVAYTLFYFYQCGERMKYMYISLLFVSMIPTYWNCIKAYRNPIYAQAVYQFSFSDNRKNLRENGTFIISQEE